MLFIELSKTSNNYFIKYFVLLGLVDKLNNIYIIRRINVPLLASDMYTLWY